MMTGTPKVTTKADGTTETTNFPDSYKYKDCQYYPLATQKTDNGVTTVDYGI